jgi:hypothetical protein
MMGLGQTIANTATDYFKDQNEKKKLLKQSSTQIDAAIKLYPELQGAFAPILDNLRDENISLNDRFASASAAPGLIELAIGQSNKNRDFGLKSRELDIQEGNYRRQDIANQKAAYIDANKPLKLTDDVYITGDNKGIDILKDDFGNIYDRQTKLRIINPEGYAAGLPFDQVLEQKDANGMPIFSVNQAEPINAGGVLPELPSNVPQPSAEQQAILDSGGAVPPDVVTTPQSANPIEGAANLSGGQPSQLTPRSRSIAGDSKAETLMTAQQVQDLAIQGFKINARPLADGSFMVSGADIGGAGETIESVPGGGFKITRGGSNVKAEKATEARKEQQGSFVNEFFKTASETLKMIPNLPDNPIGAKVGAILGNVLPGTETGRVVSRLGTLKANLALDKINQLREASPTGGAAGNMTEKEWPLFMQEFGALDAAEYKPDLEARLKNASVKLFNRVNGTPEQRAAALRNGIITNENNQIVETEYNKMLSDLNISTPTAPAASKSPLFSPETEATINKHLPK